MYKLMIAEDEALARNAILKLIDFQKQGFEIVAVCEDGQQAVQAYLEKSPDLVVTDICMPFVSGLQLAEMIAKAERGTQVVILTGYDDFNFARQAINSQVARYILKPVTPAEFEEVLAQARKKLDEQADRRHQIATAQRQLHMSNPIVRDQLLNRLVQGSADSSAIGAELEPFGISRQASHYLMAIVQVENLSEAASAMKVNSQLVQFMVANVAAELTASYPGIVAFQLTDGRTSLIGAMDDPAGLGRQMRDLSRQIRNSVQQVLNIKLTIGGGNPVPSLDLVRTSYLSAQRCLDHRILMPDFSIIFPDDIRIQAQAIDLTELEDKIILQVRLLEEVKVGEAIDKYVQALRLSGRSKPDIQFERNRMAGRLATAVHSESGGQEPALDPIMIANDDSSFLERFKSWLKDYCLACIKLLRSRRGSESQRISALACQYIQDHYADSQLSLLEVCNYTAVSLSYFSQLFKEETGKTFVEYLTEIRMEKAQELLRNSNRLLYDIAELVGFANPAYFTAAFKKHVGLSPRDYRKQFGRGN
jgi:two-component system response regulator YesN